MKEGASRRTLRLTPRTARAIKQELARVAALRERALRQYRRAATPELRSESSDAMTYCGAVNQALSWALHDNAAAPSRCVPFVDLARPARRRPTAPSKKRSP